MYSPENRQMLQRLPDGLVLKSLHTLEDVERWALFQAEIHGEEVAAMCRALVLHHPATRPSEWLYIEEEATGRIVSALCLIPWRWRYEGVELRAGELAIVGTAAEFRNRGLSRTLTRQHHALLEAGAYDISHIQGIPYFYRQFGYEYALPLEGGSHLELRQVREVGATGYTLRPAGEGDIGVLSGFYQEAVGALAISTERSEAEWGYLLTHSQGTETAVDYYLVMDGEGETAGYVGVQRFGFGEGLNVAEISRLSGEAAGAVLGLLKQMAVERGKPFIRLIPPEQTSLQRVAAAWGAHSAGRYAWQIHIPNPARLLRKIRPVLERRLAGSDWAGWTGSVPINLYREGVRLDFEGGKLVGVEAVAGEQRGGISLPPLLLAQLVLGWQTAEALAGIYPDVSIRPEWKTRVEILFPKLDGFLYSPY